VRDHRQISNDETRVEIMKRVWLPVLAVAIVTPCARADQWHKHWNTAGTPQIRISGSDAAVVVEAAEIDGIEATLRTQGWPIGRNGVQVTEHQEGSDISIEIALPAFRLGWSNASASLEVRVAKEIMGEFRTGDGSLTIRGVHGTIKARTSDGNIVAEDVDGTLDARRTDGAIQARGRFDLVQARATDGRIDIVALPGSRLKSAWTIASGDGDAQLKVPRDLAATVILQSHDGRVRFDLPLRVNGQVREHEVEGLLNGGGPRLTVQAADGSVTLGPS